MIHARPIPDTAAAPASGPWGHDANATRACRALWGAVLRTCLLDVLRGAPACDDSARVETRDGWIGSRDFFTVCALAGVDGTAVIRALEAARADGTLPDLIFRLSHMRTGSCEGADMAEAA